MKSILFILSTGFLVSVTFFTNFWIKSIFIILVIVTTATIYYNTTILQSIVISLIYYGILLGIDYLLLVLFQLLLPEKYLVTLHNPLSGTIIALLYKIALLLIVVIIRKAWKSEDNLNMISNKEWIVLSCFPLFTVVSMAGMLFGYNNTNENISNIFLVIAFGLVALNFLAFYLIHDIVNRESANRNSRLIQERTKNQMNIYKNMHDTYERQQKKTHDYKNQLICIQGMLANGNTDEAKEYLSRLTGNLVRDMNIVHTNQAVADAVINQKYKYAQGKGISFIIKVSDLSNLTMSEEDLVTVLSNILDNAIEACEKLENNKIIKFKITVENDQLLISVQNPVIEPVKIVDNRIVTTKANKAEHGIGLLNIITVVEKYNGSYAVSYKEGWFFVTVLIPLLYD